MFFYLSLYVCVFFSFWLISLIIMHSSPTHVVTNGFLSFSWLSNICVCVYIYVYVYLTSSSIQPLTDCLHNLVIVNNAAMNISVQTSFWDTYFISLDVYPGVVLPDHMVVQYLIFWETAILSFILVVSICIPTSSI